MSCEVITWTKALSDFAFCGDTIVFLFDLTAVHFRTGIFSRAHGTANAKRFKVDPQGRPQMTLPRRDKMSQCLYIMQIHHPHFWACRSPEGPLQTMGLT